MTRSLIYLLICLIMGVEVSGDDWPQWMGPRRDNIWRESGIIKQFPASGLKIVWRVPVAGGYSGPAIAKGRVYVTDYVTAADVKVQNFERKQFSGTERLLCFNANTGKRIWKREYPVKYNISYPAGPRCTPIVHQNKVYSLGAEGHLKCFQVEEGKLLWEKNFPEEFNTKTDLWGYASHPLIDGNKLICIVGGQGSHAVAFNIDTGKEIWKSVTASSQGYAPPTIIEAGGVRQLILFRPDAVTSLNPVNGKKYWSIPYESSSGSAIMSPVFSGTELFVGGFSKKNMMLKINKNHPNATVKWQNISRQAMAPINVQPFLEQGMLYGFDQNGMMYGVEFTTGKRVWESLQPMKSKRPQNSATAFIVKQHDRFWMFNELGELLIVQLSPEGFKELSRAKVIEPSNVAFGRQVVWSAPAYANQKAFIRNDKECICVELAADAY